MENVSLEKKFLELLVGLEAVEFVGLCKFLGVRLVEENDGAAHREDNDEAEELGTEEVEVVAIDGVEVKDLPFASKMTIPTSSGVQSAAPQNCAKPLDFTDLLSQLMEKFSKLSRTRKRELIKILKKVNK